MLASPFSAPCLSYFRSHSHTLTPTRHSLADQPPTTYSHTTTHSSPQVLDLSSNEFSADGVGVIADATMAAAGLRQLRLLGNKIPFGLDTLRTLMQVGVGVCVVCVWGCVWGCVCGCVRVLRTIADGSSVPLIKPQILAPVTLKPQQLTRHHTTG